MTLFKSIHPTLDIPTDITTWEWAFEHPKYSPVIQAIRDPAIRVGHYTNAFTKETLDFHQVKDRATRLSTALVQKYGLKPDQTVSLFSTNSIWYPVAMWATVRVGGRVNGASPAYSAEEMAHALRVADSRILITLPGPSLEVALRAADTVGIPRSNVLLLEGQQDGFTSIQSLIDEYSSTPSPSRKVTRQVEYYRIPPGKTNLQVCGYLNFSSGTTGLPKAVMLSHHNVIAQCHLLKQIQTVTETEAEDAGPLRYKILAVMPLFHITGLVRFCTYPLAMNGHCIMLPAYTMEAMLRAIIEYRVEELILVPPIITRLVRDPVVDKYLAALRRVVARWSSGSAPVSGAVVSQLEAKFPGTGFRQGYGATESTGCISAHPPSHFDFRYAHTGGMLMANTVAKVVSLDDPGKRLGPGQTGEICAKGPQIAMGYLGNEAATRESFDEEGFLHTGDVGYIDSEGFIHVEDRIKEMIKVKGQQVAPAELEAVLLGQEVVEDAAVVGVRDYYAGERPKAFVVLKKKARPKNRSKGGGDGEEAAAIAVGKALMEVVKSNKVKYKWLVEIEFVDELPKNPTGKLLRRVLKTWETDPGRVRGVIVSEEKKSQSERARL